MPRFLINWLLACLLGLQGCAGPQLDYVADIAPDVPYTFAAGDRLRVIVFGQDGLSNSYSIDGGGSISMPLIGIIPARGLTTRQLERGIEARLRNGFLREPRVSVEIEAYRPFFILGEITAAGQYPYINGMTVQNAIAVAGGFTPRAARTDVDLTRIIDGRAITMAAPLNTAVYPGDTITVRERWF